MTHAFSGHVLKAQYIQIIHMSVIHLKHTCLSDIQSDDDDDDDQPILWAESVTLSSYRSRDFFISRALLFCVKDFIMSGWMIDTRDWPWEKHSLNILYNQTSSSQKLIKLYWPQKMWQQKPPRQQSGKCASDLFICCLHWFILNDSAMWQFNLKCTWN